MPQIIESNGIYSAIDQLKAATAMHNSTFDEANKIFSDVEDSLKQINIDYWYPYQLTPKQVAPSASFSAPQLLTLYTPLQPFFVTTYQLGYLSKRLLIRKITSHYDYERDAWGNVIYNMYNNLPYTKKIKDDVCEPIPVSDSSRELRVMVIENLPGFIAFIRESITAHTQTLHYALGNLR